MRGNIYKSLVSQPPRPYFITIEKKKIIFFFEKKKKKTSVNCFEPSNFIK
jgi:hypothetical protein